MATNFLGPVNCLAALQTQLEAGDRVVLVSSMAHWLPFPRAEAYGASKAALSWFANSLRLDWEPKGVAVTVVSPGFVDTPLTRKNDFAMPGRVSVDRAVAAIRHGLAKGKTTSPSPPASAACGCWPASHRVSSACCCAGWCAHEHRHHRQRHRRADLRRRLAGHHQVTLFEAGATPGGHTATVDVATPQGTGPSIPDLSSTTIAPIRALWACSASWGSAGKNADELLGPQPGQRHEYNGHSLTSLFAQRRNLLKPAFWGLLSEIVRFNRTAKLALTEALDPGATLESFLARHRFSPFFARHYILPMGAAIWSSSLQEMRRFPLPLFCASLKTTVCWIFAIARNGTWCPVVPGNTSAPCSSGSAIARIYASTRRCSRWTATRRGHPAAGVRGGAF